MLWIKKLLPKNRFEREALLKAFIIFFLTIELFIGVITFLLLKIETEHLKHNIYLRLINYSYTFEGKDFKIDVVEINNFKDLYGFKESEEGFYILVPIPGVEKDVLKIIYPREKFLEDIKQILKEFGAFFVIATLINTVISYFFALYTIIPLRKAIELITEVARDISHDMNTPLTSLVLNLSILKKKSDEQAIKRMEMAINQLKYLRENLSKFQEKTILRREEVNIKDILEASLRDISKLYPDITLKVQAENVKILADRNAVKRIIDNLVVNAFKHNIKNGEVNIILTKEGLIIENTSKPIKNINKIFERFYKESQRGTGLGLAVVKQLVDELNWKIKAEYKNGKFRISLSWKRE
ncbi:sensor histidine kinase [Aquifex sp.]